MSDSSKDLVKKHLGNDFQDVLGDVLDETYGDDEQVKEEPSAVFDLYASEKKENEDDDSFDFSQFKSVLDGLDDEKVEAAKTEKKDDFVFDINSIPEEFDVEIGGEAVEEMVPKIEEKVFEEVKSELKPEVKIEEAKKEEEIEPVKEVTVPEHKKESSNSYFQNIHEKIRILEKAQKEVESLEVKQESLKKTLNEATKIVLKYVNFVSINHKGVEVSTPLEELFSAKGLFLMKEKGYELWILQDGSLIEFDVKESRQVGS